MPNKNQILGQARINVDGVLYDTDKGATLELGGKVRTGVEGDNTAGAFQESTGAAKLSCSIFIKPGVRVTDIREIDNATITFTADTGQVLIMRNAFASDGQTMNQSDGKLAIMFESPPSEEL